MKTSIMCQYKTICNTSFGCLIQCKNCDQFHLGFGNLVLILSHDDFVRFTEQVYSIHLHHYKEKKASQKKIYMHTDSRKMALCFSPTEWINLYELLEEARFLISATDILEQH